jgi:hypothetical protein
MDSNANLDKYIPPTSINIHKDTPNIPTIIVAVIFAEAIATIAIPNNTVNTANIIQNIISLNLAKPISVLLKLIHVSFGTVKRLFCNCNVVLIDCFIFADGNVVTDGNVVALSKESQISGEALNAILLRKTSPAIKQENKVNNINIDTIANI